MERIEGGWKTIDWQEHEIAIEGIMLCEWSALFASLTFLPIVNLNEKKKKKRIINSNQQNKMSPPPWMSKFQEGNMICEFAIARKYEIIRNTKSIKWSRFPCQNCYVTCFGTSNMHIYFLIKNKSKKYKLLQNNTLFIN